MVSVCGAQAGAWDEFEARCLVPMENFEAPRTDGFEVSRSYGTSELFLNDLLRLSVSRDNGHITGCDGVGVETTFNANGPLSNTRHKIIDNAIAHFDAQQALDRYRLIEVSQEPYQDILFERRVLHSHLWREPVLEVVLEVWPTHGSISVKETDLES
ncbi:hypothetical protein C8N43_2305 [Litoreibacter ponti]|uniref:Uncharacterized protein n=2 Tax=Litoreibacter ponti TaxID=1510457 RepID=A0A2T6BNL8_9RHOB|nr:hypothetical protein C8N43_2305 [Litoreibacter ponti]